MKQKQEKDNVGKRTGYKKQQTMLPSCKKIKIVNFDANL